MLPHSIFPKQLTLIVNNPLYKTGCCENHSTTYTGDMQTPLPTACEVAVWEIHRIEDWLKLKQKTKEKVVWGRKKILAVSVAEILKTLISATFLKINEDLNLQWKRKTG